MKIKKPSSMCFEEVENLCKNYNSKCKLSTIAFYPTGGLLYHYYADIFDFALPDNKDCVSGEPMYDTPDIDGYFMILPEKINLKTLRQNYARNTYEIGLEAVYEALKKIEKTELFSDFYEKLETLKLSLQDYLQLTTDSNIPQSDEYYDGVNIGGEEQTKLICKFDVHVNIVKKPLFSMILTKKEEMKGYFFGSDGTELVLNRWTTVPNYKHVYIVDPRAHVYDQLYTVYDRSNKIWTKFLKQVEDGKINNKSFWRMMLQSGRFKMQKTAFRLKILCQNILPGMTISELFKHMEGKTFEGTVDFDLLHEKISKETNGFLATYGRQTIEEFCNDRIKQVEKVCTKIQDLTTSQFTLKF